MENYHINMKMGMYSIEPPWISVYLIKAYRRNIDIRTVNRDKNFGLNLVIWGKFYEDLHGWKAYFGSPGRGA